MVDSEFLEHLKSVAKDRQTSVSQMLRYVMAVETGYKAPQEWESTSDGHWGEESREPSVSLSLSSYRSYLFYL